MINARTERAEDRKRINYANYTSRESYGSYESCEEKGTAESRLRPGEVRRGLPRPANTRTPAPPQSREPCEPCASRGFSGSRDSIVSGDSFVSPAACDSRAPAAGAPPGPPYPFSRRKDS